MAEEALFGLLAPHHTRRDDADQAGEIPVPGVDVEGGQDWLGEDVTHDDQAVDLHVATVSSSSTGSNWREVRVTTLPPSLRHSRAVKPPVPCVRRQGGGSCPGHPAAARPGGGRHAEAQAASEVAAAETAPTEIAEGEPDQAQDADLDTAKPPRPADNKEKD